METTNFDSQLVTRLALPLEGQGEAINQLAGEQE
jgi:hypothetical protein